MLMPLTPVRLSLQSPSDTDGSISNASWDFQPETSIDPPRTGITGVKGISISVYSIIHA
jgi:hypothetical protein